MSEVFDPEKVDRWDCEASGNVVEASDGQYIRAADYDKLLALYREAVGDRLSTWKESTKPSALCNPVKPEGCTCDWVYDWTTSTAYHHESCALITALKQPETQKRPHL